MKLLLTSAGLTKESIAQSLIDLVGKSPSKTRVALIPTAANVEEGNKDWFINQLLNLWRYGFKDIDIVDPTAVDVDWRNRLLDVDVIFVSGGNTFHLLNQFRKTGFINWLDESKDSKVYVGVSAGTIIATPTIQIAGLEPNPDPNLPKIKDLVGLGWVNVEIEPHCDMARFDVVEQYAKNRPNKVYALDDLSALKVVDGKIEVISEGYWKVFGSV